MRYTLYLNLFIAVFFCSNTLFAQRFGGNPGSIKWKQIDGKATKLIFPASATAEAKRTFSIMEQMAISMQTSLGDDFRKIPVVLQTQPVVSNAYVGLAPWRSEFFLRPPQNALFLGSTGWIDNLAIHEYRHVHQYGNFRKGLSRWAYWIAGEEGQALANAAAIPDWFFEGDAVYSETKLLSQGRGRLPFFYDPFHAIWQANKQYSFQKLRSGSLKDIVPNHYLLGYILVAYGYAQYGDDFWKKVTADAVAFKGWVYPMQRAIKKHSGLEYKQFVDQALADYKGRMPQVNQQRVGDSTETRLEPETGTVAAAVPSVGPAAALIRGLSLGSHADSMVTPYNTRTVVHHYFPVWVGEDSLLVLRKPFNQVPHWTILSKGMATKIGVKDIGVDDYFSYKNRYVVFTAYSPDSRWNWREFSDIRLFNIDARVSSSVTKGKRYFSPDLAHGGDKIVAVDVSGEGRASIHLLEVASGKLTRAYTHPEGLHFSYPVFGADDNQVYVAARKVNGENTILQLDLASGNFTALFPFVNAPISYLRYKDNQLLFSITQQNRNEFWKRDLFSGKTVVLSSSFTGSYSGDIDTENGKVVYTRPTAEGEQVFVRIADHTVHEINGIEPVNGVQADTFTAHAGDSVTAYKPLSRPINVHSWRPFYEQPEWSFSLYGQNLLNTVQSSVEYAYNENEGSHRVGAGLAYGGLYPWITAGTSYTMNRTFRDSLRLINWNEWNGNIGVRIPLNFSAGKFFKQLDLTSRLHGTSLSYDPKSRPLPFNRLIGYVQNQISWAVQTQQAVQQFHPRFGFAARINSRFAVGNTRASQLLMGSQLFLPGVGKNHSFVFAAHYQRRDTLGQYIFSNAFPTARGYPALDNPRMWRLSYNYHFPLLYPDFGVGNIVYVQRLRANIFYDNMHLKSLRTGRVVNLRTLGTEILFETKWWNQQPVTFGVRYSRLLDASLFLVRPNANQWELIMPINLIPNQ